MRNAELNSPYALLYMKNTTHIGSHFSPNFSKKYQKSTNPLRSFSSLEKK